MTIKTYVFDIDGTIADVSDRLHYVTPPNRDWNTFFDRVIDDKPIWPIIDLVNIISMHCVRDGSDDPDRDQYDIVFVTGRPERCREQTVKWMAKYFGSVAFSFSIMMRADGDHRPDHVIKSEIIDQLIDQDCEIVFAVDDRDSVVQMYRNRGITCLQCANGNY